MRDETHMEVIVLVLTKLKWVTRGLVLHSDDPELSPGLVDLFTTSWVESGSLLS